MQIPATRTVARKPSIGGLYGCAGRAWHTNLQCANVSSNSTRAEKVCGWDGGHLVGLTVWNLQNYTRIEKAHKIRKKTRFFIMWPFNMQPLGHRTDTGLFGPLWSIHLNCQLLTKLEMMYTLQAQVYGCLSAQHLRLPHRKTK